MWNLSICSCENGNYLASIMNNSAITYDKFIEAEAKSNDQKTKSFLTNFNEKK